MLIVCYLIDNYDSIKPHLQKFYNKKFNKLDDKKVTSLDTKLEELDEKLKELDDIVF